LGKSLLVKRVRAQVLPFSPPPIEGGRAQCDPGRPSGRRFKESSMAATGMAIVIRLQPHWTAAGVQPPQNADQSFASYSNATRQTLEWARCSPQSLGEPGRRAPQQTDRPQRESSSSERLLAG